MVSHHNEPAAVGKILDINYLDARNQAQERFSNPANQLFHVRPIPVGEDKDMQPLIILANFPVNTPGHAQNLLTAMIFLAKITPRCILIGVAQSRRELGLYPDFPPTV
jgi:hypothetical protein